MPLFFYIPGLKQKLDVAPDRITQHIDVLPSVLDLLGISKPDRFLLGQSIFDAGKPGRAYNYMSYGYWWIDKDYFVDFWRGSHKVNVYRHTNTWNYVDLNMPESEARELEAYKDLQKQDQLNQ